MIVKIKRGSGFAGVGRYLSEKDGAEMIGGNMAGRNADELSSEFGMIRTQRQDIEKPVWHCVLSLPPGERLNDEQWREVSEKHLRNMGMDPDRHQYALFRHSDREHDHVHILANRVSYEGEVWHGKWEGVKSRKSVQRLEMEYYLTRTPGVGQGRDKRIKESRAEKEMQARLGVDSPKKRIAAQIDEAIGKSDGTREDFEKQCQTLGVAVKWNVSKTTGRLSGVSFKLQDAPKDMANAFKGSQIGKDYSWKGLERKLIAREVEFQKGDRTHLEWFREKREKERASNLERTSGRPELFTEKAEKDQDSHLERFRAKRGQSRIDRSSGHYAGRE